MMDVPSGSKRPAATIRNNDSDQPGSPMQRDKCKTAITKMLPQDPATIRDESLKEERTGS